MKKLLICICLISIFMVFGCKSKEEKALDNLPVVGIAKIANHNALNDAEQGIIDSLKDAGFDNKIKIEKQNANGDVNIANSIASKFKSDKVAIAVGIATPMTTALINNLPDTPIVFTAVTDPVKANFAVNATQGIKNVTGVVDTIPVLDQLTKFQTIYKFKKIGIIYTGSESNSVSMAEESKKACETLNIECIYSTITAPSDINAAAESLADRVDAFYFFTDNNLAVGLSNLTDIARAKKIPVFGGDITPMVNGNVRGILYALGFNYYDMGYQTGNIIADILNGKKPEDIPISTVTNSNAYESFIDLDAAKNLGLNIPNTVIDTTSYVIDNGQFVKEPKK